MARLTEDEEQYVARLEKGRLNPSYRWTLPVIFLIAGVHLFFGLRFKNDAPVLSRDLFWLAGWWFTSGLFLGLMTRIRNRLLSIIGKLRG